MTARRFTHLQSTKYMTNR